jgi:molybdate transport system substrate-binding protein
MLNYTKKNIIFVFLITVTFIASLLLPSFAQSNAELTISAAASLTNALQEIKPIYEQKNPQINLVYNFGSSGSLQQQIEQGAPVDIFISAASKQMDALESKNLLMADTCRNLLTNQIVLITPQNLAGVSSFQDLTKPEVKRIALGDPKSVPAGQYAQETLTFYNLLESLQDKFVYAKDVKQVLSYVELENVEAGLVYMTDAKTSNNVQIIAVAEPQSHSPIVYPVAIIKDSKQVDMSKEFIEFLFSTDAQEIFTKYGFQIGE